VNKSNKLLSDVVAFRTYAKYLKHLGRRESLEETINRNMQMHLERFPKLSRDILKAYKQVHDLNQMPSMRGMQFGGEAILKNNVRQYNCSFVHIKYPRVFAEVLYVLLCGTGAGYSIQKHHTNQLPSIKWAKEEGTYIIHDSIEGWAEALNQLMNAYFYGAVRPIFDFSNIRAKGSYLVTTGAKAPGPEPLRQMLKKVEAILKEARGRKLKTIEIHDIVCIVADCVLAGGIRRAALICLFDRDDKDMLECKHGEWWNHAPYRARANNSAVLPRNEVGRDEFKYIYDMCIKSNSGEPGFFWTNDADWGMNPCVTEDTEVLTDDGYKTIKSLVGKKVNVWNGFEFSKVEPQITGYNQKILKIKFSDGRELKCTPAHNFYLADGYTNKYIKVKAKDLHIGNKLIKHKYPVIEHGSDIDDKIAYTQGFYSADGVKDSNFAWLYEPKYMIKSRLDIKTESSSYETYSGTKRKRVSFNKKVQSKDFVPFNWNLKSKLNWLAGLFDGDGCELNEGGLQLASVDHTFLSNLQKLLSTCGVSSKIVNGYEKGYRTLPNGKNEPKKFLCKELKRICISASSMQDLKKLGLVCERLKFNKNPNRDASRFTTIVEIEPIGTVDKVYCFRESKRGMGCFNGVVTGQCAEIGLHTNQFCNLTTTNLTGIKNKKDMMNRIYASSLIGTLQASYTDFPYLSDEWKYTTENEALLGCSFTGIADAGKILAGDLNDAAKLVLEVNEKYAKKIGINPAARTTTVKPEGTSSCVMGSSSGIHARHDEYYLRRIRMNKDDALARYLSTTIPDLIEDDLFSPTGIVVTIPQHSPEKALIRGNETAKSLFNRCMFFYRNWVMKGHRSGVNTHNVSVTISYKQDEVESLFEDLWDNREKYAAVSLLPFDGGTYQQAPFEGCDKETFEKYDKVVNEIDLTKVIELEDNTDRIQQIACSGGVCEIV
jgi:ribonucleotide reductase class II